MQHTYYDYSETFRGHRPILTDTGLFIYRNDWYICNGKTEKQRLSEIRRYLNCKEIKADHKNSWFSNSVHGSRFTPLTIIYEGGK